MAVLTPEEFLAKWKTSKLLMNASSSYNTQIWKEFIDDLIDSLSTGGGGDSGLGNVKIYRALLTSNGGFMTVVVLNNADTNYLGDIVWEQDALGVFHGTLVGEFPVSKVQVFVNDGSDSTITTGKRSTDDLVIIEAYDDAGSASNIGLASVLIIVNQ